MPSRTVRIVGDPEPWEVLCATPTSMILVNRQARRRDEIAMLERKLADVRAQLVARQAETDVSGIPMDGP